MLVASLWLCEAVRAAPPSANSTACQPAPAGCPVVCNAAGLLVQRCNGTLFVRGSTVVVSDLLKTVAVADENLQLTARELLVDAPIVLPGRDVCLGSNSLDVLSNSAVIDVHGAPSGISCSAPCPPAPMPSAAGAAGTTGFSGGAGRNSGNVLIKYAKMNAPAALHIDLTGGSGGAAQRGSAGSAGAAGANSPSGQRCDADCDPPNPGCCSNIKGAGNGQAGGIGGLNGCGGPGGVGGVLTIVSPQQPSSGAFSAAVPGGAAGATPSQLSPGGSGGPPGATAPFRFCHPTIFWTHCRTATTWAGHAGPPGRTAAPPSCPNTQPGAAGRTEWLPLQ